MNRHYSRFFRKQYFCRFAKANVEFIDYKDMDLYKDCLTETGKIIPSRITGTSAKYQRQLATAVKRARYMSLIPYCDHHKN